MADQLRLRGGPTAQSEIFVGAEREITVDTGLKRLRIHDGVTAGGHLLNGKADLDSAIAIINQTIDDNAAADEQARLDLKVLLEQEIADQEAEDTAARAVLQTAIDAEEVASAAYDVQQDNRISVLEIVNEINKKELSYITLVGTASPATGQVGVNSFTPSAISMLVLPKTDADGKTIVASDFLVGDRIGLKQTNGSAAIYFVLDPGFDFGDHVRINVDDAATVLGAAADQLFVENNSVNAVFEDTSVTRGAMTAGFSTEATARESAVTSLTALITALQTRATALELDPVTKTYVDTQISDLINGAPDALNQLNEIIAAFEGADTSLIGDLSGLGVRITALESDTTSATAVAAVQADVDQNETDSDAADAALSARLDTLEADDTTATALAAETAARIAGDASTLSSANTYTDTSISNLVNGADSALDTLKEIGDALATGDTDVTTALTTQITTESTTRAAADTAETTARTSADTALSGRLDTLEADPTTATAVTAASAASAALVTTEENARIAADLAETTARTAAITAEATARASAIAAETTSRQNAVSAEEAARIAADNTLTTNLATTNTNLTATNTAFAAADANLQTQVDAATTIEAATEVRNLRAGLCFGQLYVTDLVVA